MSESVSCSKLLAFPGLRGPEQNKFCFLFLVIIQKYFLLNYINLKKLGDLIFVNILFLLRKSFYTLSFNHFQLWHLRVSNGRSQLFAASQNASLRPEALPVPLLHLREHPKCSVQESRSGSFSSHFSYWLLKYLYLLWSVVCVWLAIETKCWSVQKGSLSQTLQLNIFSYFICCTKL